MHKTFSALAASILNPASLSPIISPLNLVPYKVSLHCWSHQGLGKPPLRCIGAPRLKQEVHGTPGPQTALELVSRNSKAVASCSVSSHSLKVTGSSHGDLKMITRAMRPASFPRLRNGLSSCGPHRHKSNLESVSSLPKITQAHGAEESLREINELIRTVRNGVKAVKMPSERLHSFILC